MKKLIVYPKNKKQLSAIKALEINFEPLGEIYPQFVLEGVNKSLKQAEKYNLLAYTNLKNMLK